MWSARKLCHSLLPFNLNCTGLFLSMILLGGGGGGGLKIRLLGPEVADRREI